MAMDGFKDASGREWLPQINTPVLLRITERCEMTLRKAALQQITIDDFCTGLWETVRLESLSRNIRGEEEWFRDCMLDDVTALQPAIDCITAKFLSALLPGVEGADSAAITDAVLLGMEKEGSAVFEDCEGKEYCPRFTISTIREATKRLGITVAVFTDPFSMRVDQIIRAAWYACRDDAKANGCRSPEDFFKRLPLASLLDCARATMRAILDAFPGKADVADDAPDPEVSKEGDEAPFDRGDGETSSSSAPSPESDQTPPPRRATRS